MGNSDKIPEYIGYAIGILAIIVSLFEKNVRGWIVRVFHKVFGRFSYLNNFFFFRMTLTFVVLVLTILALSYFGYIQPSQIIVNFVFFVLVVVSLIFMFLPYINAINSTKTALIKLEREYQIVNKSNTIELESIQNKWEEFITNLSRSPGYEVVAAYLKMSKPVRLEANTLILGLPDVILKTSQGIELERVTPLLNSFFDRKYIIRLIALD